MTGTCMMPIFPKLCDDGANLQYVVQWTAEHGGQFVLGGDLTMADQQCDFYLGVLDERLPDLVEHYRSLYPEVRPSLAQAIARLLKVWMSG